MRNDQSASYPRLTALLSREGMSQEFQACYFDSFLPATDAQVNALLKAVPWLPDDYIEFLKTTNGCVLELFVFYGIGGDHPYSIEKQQWQMEPYGSDRWFAVGHDGAGDTIAINKDGAIGTAGSDEGPDEPTVCSPDFRTLIEWVCCGQGYVAYFGGHVDDSDEWFAHIRSRGWAR